MMPSSVNHTCKQKRSHKSAAEATGHVIQHSTLKEAKLASGISQKQLITITQALRRDVAVQPYLKQELAKENMKFADLFICEEITHGTNLPKAPVIFCTNVREFLHRILKERGWEINDIKLRLSIDEGRSFLKVSASIFHKDHQIEETDLQPFKSTGVKRTFLLAISTMKEDYESISILLAKLCLDQQLEGVDFFFAQDLKCFNIALGLGAHRSTFPCLFCHWRVGC